MTNIFNNYRKQYQTLLTDGKADQAEKLLQDAQQRGALDFNLCEHIRISGESVQPKPSLIKDAGIDKTEARCRKQYGFYHADLVFGDKGSLSGNPLNLRLALEHHPDFKKDTFQLSTFHQTQFHNGSAVDDNTINSLHERLLKIFKVVARNNVAQAIDAACFRNSTHEPALWLSSLPAPTSSHLNDWLVAFARAEDTEIVRIIGRKWLIGAVARAMNPGCYVEGMLILQGDQGIGKSTLLKTLPPESSWYGDINHDLSDTKGMAEICAGKWIVEMGELDCLRKSANSATKNFLTSQFDKYRPAYARKAVNIPRGSVYAGTTNNETFLTDPSGNRRFWCVRIGRVDLPGLAKVRTSLWREALDAYNAGESWTLSEAEISLLNEVNAERMVDSRVHSFLEEELSKYADTKISSNFLLNTILTDFKSFPMQELASVMKSLGWTKKKVKIDGRSIQGYVRGAE